MTKLFKLLSATVSGQLLCSAIAYNNPSWKVDADGKVELKDGNPVYIDSQGQEKVIEIGTITRLNGESKSHRERAEAAEAKLKTFGDLDPVKAKEALDTLDKIDKKKLIDNGEVDRVTQQITQQFTAQINELKSANEKTQSAYENLLIDNVFANSEFVRENVSVPRDMFQSFFRQNFSVKDGQVVAKGKDGNQILSPTRTGEYATADEALQIMVNAHPQKDIILKADVGKGSGNQGGGGHNSRVRTMKRPEFDALPPLQQADAAAKMGKGELNIVD